VKRITLRQDQHPTLRTIYRLGQKIWAFYSLMSPRSPIGIMMALKIALIFAQMSLIHFKPI